MLRLAVAALLPVLGASYNYDRCDLAEGPYNWSGFCKGQVSSGTPINICGTVPFPSSSPAPTPEINGYSTVRSGTIKNNGHTIEVGMGDNKPWLKMGALSNIVGKTTNSTPATWILQQLHYHWGRTGRTDEGSEHFLFGTRFPIEVHFVHYNAQYGTINNALNFADGLLVVGVFFTIQETEDAFTTKVGDNVAAASTTGIAFNDFTLDGIWDGTGNYYSYSGSLTTPTCNEIVTWVVMKDPKPIKYSTLMKFQQALVTPPGTQGTITTETISLYGNYRPIQTIGTRSVWASDGTNGAACTTTVEPSFCCNVTTPNDKSGGLLTTVSPILLLSSISLILLSHM